MLAEWQRGKLLPASFLTVLWDVLQGRRPELAATATGDRRGALALLKLGKAALEADDFVKAAEQYTKLCAHKHVGDMAGKAHAGLADAYWAMWERSAERDFSDGLCYKKDALAAAAAAASAAHAKLTASASLLECDLPCLEQKPLRSHADSSPIDDNHTHVYNGVRRPLRSQADSSPQSQQPPSVAREM